jgi:hypothetical protein
MSVQTFFCRLFGGRDLGVSFDNVANTITVLGQSISIASLPAALQVEWQAAVAGASSTFQNSGRPAFAGDNIGAIVGAILDNQPTWRSAVLAALANYVSEQTAGGTVAGIESFNR